MADNTDKCKVMHIGQNNSKISYNMNQIIDWQLLLMKKTWVYILITD